MPDCNWCGKTAEFKVTIPGNPDGGIEWFGGPEPDTELLLCLQCAQKAAIENEGVISELLPVSSEGNRSHPERF